MPKHWREPKLPLYARLEEKTSVTVEVAADPAKVSAAVVEVKVSEVARGGFLFRVRLSMIFLARPACTGRFREGSRYQVMLLFRGRY
jgi:hypothetical protein